MINLQLNKQDLAKAERMLLGFEKGISKATMRALNKTVEGVRTDMVKLIRDRYTYRAAKIRDRIKLERAALNRLLASITSTGRPLHLTDSPQTKFLKASGGGVSVNIEKATGRQRLPRAFEARGKTSGKKIILHRRSVGGKLVGRYAKDKPRLPARYGPYPESIYNSPKNWKVLQDSARERLDKNFAHEVDAILKGFAK